MVATVISENVGELSVLTLRSYLSPIWVGGHNRSSVVCKNRLHQYLLASATYNWILLIKIILMDFEPERKSNFCYSSTTFFFNFLKQLYFKVYM